MKGYPMYVATKQDFVNLLSEPDFKDQAIMDLKKIYDTQDDIVTRVVSGSEETEDLVTEEVDNPLPGWKQKGFMSRQEIADLITENGGEI